MNNCQHGIVHKFEMHRFLEKKYRWGILTSRCREKNLVTLNIFCLFILKKSLNRTKIQASL